MFVGIISDTHGLLRDEVVNKLTGCDYIIHAGDMNKPEIISRLSEIAPLYVVRGNNDKEWAASIPKELYFEISGFRFFMVHDKKHIPNELEDIDIIIFGHSHNYFCEREHGVLWLNPGSCGRRRFGLPLTMVLLSIRNETYSVQKINING